MCYNYSFIESKLKKLEVRLNILNQPSLFPAVNPNTFTISGFSHLPMPIITVQDPNRIQAFKWGFIPKYATFNNNIDAKKIVFAWNSTLNCRSETMFEKVSFKDAANKGKRLLILANGFYEWHTLENGKKYPFFFELKDQEMFCIAGIYNQCINPITGEEFNGFSLITCKASPLVEKIHNAKEENDFRMPVILPKNLEKEWLNPDLSKDNIIDMCKPFDDNLLHAHSISKLITTPRVDKNIPAVQDNFQYPELVHLYATLYAMLLPT